MRSAGFTYMNFPTISDGGSVPVAIRKTGPHRVLAALHATDADGAVGDQVCDKLMCSNFDNERQRARPVAA